MELEVSHEVAAIVAEKHLLPMFKADNRISKTNKRLETKDNQLQLT